MLAGELFMMVFLAAVSGNTGNHLLDAASTEAYWRIKGVAISFEAMKKEIDAARGEDVSALVRDLGSADPQTRDAASIELVKKGPAILPQMREAEKSGDPEVAAAAGLIARQITLAGKAAGVRYLMAIRTLAELRKPEALPILRPMLDSKEMFVAEYARRAIASIEGKPYSSPQATAQQRNADLWLLPSGCSAVLQLAGFAQRVCTADDLLALVPNAKEEQFEKRAVLAEMTKEVLKIAERTGDLRIDSITVGVTGDIEQEWAVLVLRGEYDAACLAAVLAKAGDEAEEKEPGVVSAGRGERFVCASNERLIFVAGMAGKEPAQAILKALKAGKGALGEDNDMVPLIKALNTAQTGWAVAKVRGNMRDVPVIGAIEWASAILKRDEQKSMLEVVAKGRDEQAVNAAVGWINQGMQELLKEARRASRRSPAAKPILDAIEGTRCVADGKTAKLNASMIRDPAQVVMALLTMDSLAWDRDDDDDAATTRPAE